VLLARSILRPACDRPQASANHIEAACKLSPSARIHPQKALGSDLRQPALTATAVTFGDAGRML